MHNLQNLSMTSIETHSLLPCLCLVFGSGCLGTASIYALSLPGLSFTSSAEARIAEVCAETSGCSLHFLRRDERIEARPGVQLVFITDSKLSERGKTALTSVVEQNTRRPNAVVVVFEPAKPKTPANPTSTTPKTTPRGRASSVKGNQ